MIIYHIVLPDVWEQFKTQETYEAESLAAEGFIHCSYDHQLDAVLERYYKDAERVVILSIDTEKLAAELVEEPSTGGEIYPHIYGKIDRDAVVSAETRRLR